MVRNLVASPNDREDIAQDVFAAAYRNLHAYDPSRSGFSTWLLTIAGTNALNTLKKKAPAHYARAPANR